VRPVTRRVWWLRGCRPKSGGQTRYEWLYVYGFARPATGETFTLILPRVKVERMADALAAFAAHADPGGTKVLVLVVDRAGWHTAKRLAAPTRGGGGRAQGPSGSAAGRGAPPGGSRSSRSGRWSGRPWRTRPSADWPTSGGWFAGGAGGWPRTGRSSRGPSASTGP